MILRLTIFHTNDMHGRLDAMARLSSFARRLRAEAEAEGRIVFFWDAGDAADRREKICRATKGAAISPILNAMGYRLQTIGNDLALPYGPQVMEHVAARAQFPILGANFRNERDALPKGLSESVLFPLPKGLQLGVFGLTAPWKGLYSIFGLNFPDTSDLAREMIARLRQQGAAPILVLSHLGLEDDRNLAENVQGIDVIIGAHSHNLLPRGEIVAGVLIAQAGQFAEHLGRVDLTLDERGNVLGRSAQVFAIPEDEAHDPPVLQAIEQAEHEVEILMAVPIGVSEVALDLNYFDECGIGDVAADALREHMRGDIAILASGLFHRGLPQGTITRGDLNAACFSTANPHATNLRGSQIRAALERGIDPAVSHYEHGGFRGPPVGIPQISGMTVRYDPDASNGSRIRSIKINAEPLDPARLYRVAHTDAETIQEVGYLAPDADQQSEFQVPIIIGEILGAYLANHSPLPPPSTGRWQRVP